MAVQRTAADGISGPELRLSDVKNRAARYVVRFRWSIYQSRKGVRSVDDQPVTYCSRVDVVEYQPRYGAGTGTARVDFDVLEVVVFVADGV